MTRTLTVLLVLSGAAHAAVPAADSVRGAQVFRSQHCIECHAVNRVGAKIGPDLGRMADRGFTPDLLVSTMWNHAPAMWSAMTARNVRPNALDTQAAADLFAFFYAARFFEEPGDASRGKRLFTSLSCSRCHGITESKVAAAKPVSQWTSPADPIVMIEVMWSHAANMRDEMARRKINWPRLSGQDVSDLLVYVRNLPSRPESNGVFRTTSNAGAQALLIEKGCSGCHNPAEQFLSKDLRGQTLTDIAADMWNHGPILRSAPIFFEPGEMRQIVSFLWARRYLENSGNHERGKKVFAAKNCAACHNDPATGAPPLASFDRDFSGITMLSVLWQHGPAMLGRMREKHIPWPAFATREMSDLIAYLNVNDSRDAR